MLLFIYGSLVFQLLLLKIGIEGNDKLCDTPGCREVVRILEESVNTAIEPCKDFYAFACGGYKQKHRPDDSRDEELYREIHSRLGELLDQHDPESVRPENMPEHVMELLTNMYRECGESRDDGNQWAHEVKEVIDELGGMPLFTNEKKNCDTGSFAEFLAMTHKQNMLYYSVNGEGAPALFTPLVETTSQLKMTHILKMEVQSDKSYIEQPFEDKLAKFKKIMKSYALATGIAPPEDKAIEDIASFEHDLLFTNRDMDRLNRTSLTYKEFKKLLQRVIQFDIYTNNLLPYRAQLELAKSIHQQIRIYEYGYFKKLPGILLLNSCNLRYDYVFYKLIEGSYLVKDQSWGNCITALLNSPLKVALTALYLQKDFSYANNWNNIRPMAVNIRDGMKYLITNANWMTPGPKFTGREKADAMQIVLGSSQLFFSKSMLNKFYSGMEFNADMNYYANRRDLAKKFMKMMMKRIGPSDPICANDIWYLLNPLEVNAFHQPHNNQIIINPGIMLQPFYRNDFPIVYVYGMTGYTVGHEITHGFDNRGRHHAKYGTQKYWSDTQTDLEFNGRAICLEEQYDKQRVEDVTIGEVGCDGKRTLQENIADNGGIKAAFWGYRAWRAELVKHGKEELHPKFNLQKLKDFTTDQLFFLSAAQGFCESRTQQSLKKQIATEKHCPGKYRINIPFKNFEEFSNAFKCTKENNMNPPNKCSVW